jgi:hypothetical protein
MKKSLFTLLAILSGLMAVAQKNITLKINHTLGAQNFAYSQTATNNINTSFNITRLQYYISTISIKHDGGQTTNATDVYALITANPSASSIDLGNYNITNIESITFSVGVNTPENNQDPSLWPANHALSPKSPSMHWGWTAGYRFVAMEGNAGSSMNTSYEIHALGNTNYFSNTIATVGAEVNGTIEVSVFADYTKALKNINVSQGIVVHGDNAEAMTLLSNFKDGVFTSARATTGLFDIKQQNSFAVWPNPSNGQMQVVLNPNTQATKIVMTDLLGRVVYVQQIENAKATILFETTGVYFLSVYNEQNNIGTQKIAIN